ncbi:MAG: T9SS type A sorting domain-containing protein [Bacteroidetes bacterium]|nr:T9SS type A sorting domain-containing protein [Bacteroidota bacterium]
MKTSILILLLGGMVWNLPAQYISHNVLIEIEGANRIEAISECGNLLVDGPGDWFLVESESTGAPLEFAICRLFVNGHIVKALQSDARGLFPICELDFDSLIVSYVGYQSQAFSFDDLPREIQLKEGVNLPIVEVLDYHPPEVVVGCAVRRHTSYERAPVERELDAVEPAWKYYPNPTRDQVFVSVGTRKGSIPLYDLKGRLLLKKEINQSEVLLDLSRFISGSYLLVYEGKDRMDSIGLIQLI